MTPHRRQFIFRILLLLQLSAQIPVFASGWNDGAFKNPFRSLQKRPEYFLNLAGFNSFISGDAANFYGFRTGLNFEDKVKLGIGFFLMNPNDVTSPITVQEDTLSFRVTGELRVRYFNLSAEYVFYRRLPWQFSLFPIDIGVGGAYYRYNSPRAAWTMLETMDVPLVFYQPTVTAQYSLFSWFGLSAAVGYRTTLYSSGQVTEDWSSVAFSAGVKVFLDEAYREVFPQGIRIGKFTLD